MADILQRYGIKEVADVTFYHINGKTNEPDYPVLVLDSLKVTSIEQTAETAEARGGRGNAKLIVWDFGKEITINIEDALFSPKSLAIMFADGKVKGQSSETTEYGYIKRSARVVATTSSTAPEVKIDGAKVNPEEVYHITLHSDDTTSLTSGIGFWVNGEKYEVGTSETGIVATQWTEIEKGDVLFASWLQPVKSKAIITITPDSFPGTYYVTGDTMIRAERNGEDEYFQFVIPKAKMQAEQTIEMQADGDPSTFNMSLQVLRPENGEMIKFIKYEFTDLGEDAIPDYTDYITDADAITTELTKSATTGGSDGKAGTAFTAAKDGWKSNS